MSKRKRPPASSRSSRRSPEPPGFGSRDLLIRLYHRISTALGDLLFCAGWVFNQLWQQLYPVGA